MTEQARPAAAPPEASAIEEALRSLTKAFRAVQLYMPNNPARVQSIELARQAFARVWKVISQFELEVRENAFWWDGKIVSQENERAGESLPWLLYRDGIRTISFTADCETSELEVLLAFIQRARAAGNEDDDLVTMLWAADLAHISYRAVDAGDEFASEGSSPEGRGTAAGVTSAGSINVVAQAESGFFGALAPQGTVRVEDFDTTLYFLDQRESAYLQDELRREYSEDQRRLVLASLFDILETRSEAEVRKEVLGILDQLVVEFLTSGDYELVGFILRESASVSKLAVMDEVSAESLRGLPGRLSEPAVVSQLLSALDDSSRAPVTSLLESLFAELRPMALEPLAGWLGGASASPARASIERASLRLASAHTAELNRLLEQSDASVVRGALRLAGQLKTPAVVSGLIKVLRTADSSIRSDAVGVLAAVGSPSALQGLERCIDDSDREVRVSAYRAIGSRKHMGALPRLLDVIRRKEMRAFDLGEKMSLFETFGSMCGNEGVGELDSILNARGFLGPKENPETRACAARALGLIGTPAAMNALQRAADARDVVVRNAVARAMRGGQ